MTCPVGRDVERAARMLVEGGLVAIPTETVYGLAASAFDVTAIARVFDVKERPLFDPLIVHMADREQVDQLAVRIPTTASLLIEEFWPGPLTLVLPKRDTVPDLVTAGLDTVAVRVPDHPLTLELLEKTRLPLAAPSANPFGRLSPTTAEHVREQLGDRIDYILDGGPCSVGVESTVLQLADADLRAAGIAAVLLRPGGVPREAIEAIIGPVLLNEDADAKTDRGRRKPGPQTSPGMLSRHYAPVTPLLIQDRAEPPPNQRAGLLTLQATAEASRFAAVEILSASGDLVEAAAHFFAALRRLDSSGLDVIVATPFPDRGLGLALNDRLRRAAKRR